MLLIVQFNNGWGQLPDSVMAYRYLELFREYEYIDLDKAAIYVDSAFYFAESSGADHILGSAHQYKGWYYQDNSKYREAIQEFLRALEHFTKAGDKQGIADAYGNLGNGYMDIDDMKKSLEYQMLSMKKNDEIIAAKPVGARLERAEEGRSYAIHNIGAIYLEVGLLEKALEYEHLSILHEKKTKNVIGEAVSYNSMGVIHHQLNHPDSAIYYFKKALAIYNKNPSDYERSSTLFHYAMMENSDLSEKRRSEMIHKAVSLRRDLGDLNGESQVLIDWCLLKFNDISNDSVVRVLKKTKEYIDDYDLDSREESYYLLLSKYKARTGDFNSAYEAVMNYLDHKSIAEVRKQTNELVASEINYQWQQKSYYDSLKKAVELRDAEMTKKLAVSRLTSYLWIAALGILVISISLYYYIRSNRRKQKMNEVLTEKNDLINEQKLILEEAHQSVAESIRYAEHLQMAILPAPKLVNAYLPDSFLMFLPRDVVSGDFYWFEIKDEYLYLAVADCTGHGVPGALVSVVCSNALNRSLHEFNCSQPSDILNKTRDLVLETFSKSGKNIDDGMDISLVRYNVNEMKISFSGANNPLWLIRMDGNTAELTEYKGDRMPVGYYPKQESFTEVEIELKKGDMLYQMSDGFVDQFGESEGKRFKSVNLKKLLIEISGQAVGDQQQKLLDTFNAWKGDTDQVDDVTIIGYRI